MTPSTWYKCLAPAPEALGDAETALPTANRIRISRPDDVETKRREEDGESVTFVCD